MLLPAHIVDRSPRTCDELDRKTAALRAQFEELWDQGQGVDVPQGRLVWVTCPCGRRVPLYRAYKCAECGFYLCGPCAKRHFDLPSRPILRAIEEEATEP